MKKLHFIKPLLILIFMFFVCFKTIDYLYKNNNVNNEEYIKILLSESYKKENQKFFANLNKLFSKIFNPKDMLEFSSKDYTQDEYSYDALRLHSKHIIDTNKTDSNKPLVYIYNTHQLENYSKEGVYAYNITPNVMMTSYLLKENLKKLNIESIVLDENIKESNDYFNISRNYLLKYKEKYPSIKYYIDIHRSNALKNLTTIKIDDINYARTQFIIGMDNDTYKNNYNIATLLSSKLNEKYPGISRGIYKKESVSLNQDIDSNVILLEFGGIENNIEEILNTIEAFVVVFSEYVGEYNGS